MTKIRLTDGTILNCESVGLESGTLKIATKERTVEELAAIFRDKEKTANITLLTESGKESGYKTGFTSFAGISYEPDGSKTVEMFQPVNATERRISIAEGKASLAEQEVKTLQGNLDEAITEITTAISGYAAY